MRGSSEPINVSFSLAHEPRLLRGLKSDPTRFICPICGKETVGYLNDNYAVYCDGRTFTKREATNDRK